MGLATIELAADNVAARGINPLALAGPPYQVRWGVQHGDTWPDVKLIVMVGDSPLAVIQTTEPRLKQTLQAILAELS